MKDCELIFCYNASGNLFSLLTDFMHKVLSPSTYQCRLCSLTYDSFAMKKEWETFIENLPAKTIFLYKDELLAQHNIECELPAVFISFAKKIKQIISAEEIEKCKSLQELKILVTQKLAGYVQHHHSHI